MRQLFSRLLVVALLLVVCRGVAWGDDLTATVIPYDITGIPKYELKSLQEALRRWDLSRVWGIEVTAGKFETTDWEWLKDNSAELSRLEEFVVTDGIESVADIPTTIKGSPYFSSPLKKLSIAKLKRVGDYALQGCVSLTSVSLPDATEIGNGAFTGCVKLESVSLPAAKKIGSEAFKGCKILTSVSLPVATEIGDDAFRDCGGLKSLQLGATPPSVGKDAFFGCPLVRKLELLNADGTPLTGDALTNAKSKYKAAEDGDIEDNLWYGWAFEDVPGNLIGSIDGVAFSGKASLQEAMQGKELDKVRELTITGGSFQVADWAYLLEQGQHGLAIETFTVGGKVDRVADMPDLPYGSPRYLPKVQKVIIAKMRKVVNYAFNDCTSLTSVSLPEATEIGDYAFKGCTGLTSVSLPKATVIGSEAFKGCKSLEDVSLSKATVIGSEAFYDCTGLDSISLPAATEVDSVAFYYCTSLKSVSLPAATKIGAKAFGSCDSLTSLQLGATPPTSVRRDAFLGCPLVRRLVLIDANGTPLENDALANAKSKYKAEEDGDTEDNLWYVWAFEGAPASNLSGSIDGDAFTNAASLEVAMKDKDPSEVKELTITGGNFQVSDWAFLLDKGQAGLALEKFTIKSSVDRVADMPDLPYDGPRYLPKAQEVTIAKMRRIGDLAFNGCTILTSVSLPEATVIGEWAFYGCKALTGVSLPAATKIGKNAFNGCESLASISLSKATVIDDNAFKSCEKLTSVTLPAATEIGDNAFESCSSLESVSLPVAQKIGHYAFFYCRSLKSVSLPVAEDIGYEAFEGCRAHKHLQLGAEPPSVFHSFSNGSQESRTLLITDAAGVPLVGQALAAAADKYDRAEGATNDKKWYGWTIQMDPPRMGTVEITPAGSGTVSITRKDGGEVVNPGNGLKNGETLIVTVTPKSGYKYNKKTTAEGAKDNGNNEWEVTATSGEVIFTVEFEKLATLGATVITPAGSGTVSITRKDGGEVVNPGNGLKNGETLIVTVTPKSGYKYNKKTTAEGAKDNGNNEWEVTAESGEVVFTVEFEKAQEENSNNDPTPVESVLLAQVQLSPNPADGQVTVDAGTAIARCEVYTSTGALLQAIESPESVFSIDLTASPSGMYLVRLVDMHGGCKTLRVVKQ